MCNPPIILDLKLFHEVQGFFLYFKGYENFWTMQVKVCHKILLLSPKGVITEFKYFTWILFLSMIDRTAVLRQINHDTLDMGLDYR